VNTVVLFRRCVHSRNRWGAVLSASFLEAFTAMLPTVT
jgi:hypothetical protein